MTHDQLIALRSCVALAEHHIRNRSRGRARLDWTRLLRKAWQGVREVSAQWIADHPKEVEARYGRSA